MAHIRLIYPISFGDVRQRRPEHFNESGVPVRVVVRMCGPNLVLPEVRQARQFRTIDSSRDDKKRTADRDHIFEKGDRKIVPSDRSYQPFGISLRAALMRSFHFYACLIGYPRRSRRRSPSTYLR